MTGAPDTRPTWSRCLLVGGAALALLLLGAALGVLIGVPGSSGSDVPGRDSVDVGFAQDMTVHHEQAVEMAGWERDHTADPRLGQLAYDIETGQGRQIGHMQGWLALWGAPGLPTGRHMAWMSAVGHDHRGMDDHRGMAPDSGTNGMAPASDRSGAAPDSGATGVARMPGMASPAELRQLRAATGRELDVLFLQLMLRHHEGGTAMADYAERHAAIADVRTLAGKMRTAQTAESAYLRQLLAERGAAPLPD